MNETSNQSTQQSKFPSTMTTIKHVTATSTQPSLPTSTWSEWGNMGNNGGSLTTTRDTTEISSSTPGSPPLEVIDFPSPVGFPAASSSTSSENVQSTVTSESSDSDFPSPSEIAASTQPSTSLYTSSNIYQDLTTSSTDQSFTFEAGSIVPGSILSTTTIQNSITETNSQTSKLERTTSLIPAVSSSPVTSEGESTLGDLPTPPATFPTLVQTEGDITATAATEQETETGFTTTTTTSDQFMIAHYDSTENPLVSISATINDVALRTTIHQFEGDFPAPTLLATSLNSEEDVGWSGGASDSFPNPINLPLATATKKRSVLVLKLKIPDGLDVEQFDFATNITESLQRAVREVSLRKHRRKRFIRYNNTTTIQLDRINKESGSVELVYVLPDYAEGDEKDLFNFSNADMESFLPFPVISIHREIEEERGINYMMFGLLVLGLSLTLMCVSFRAVVKVMSARLLVDVSRFFTGENDVRQTRIHSIETVIDQKT